MGTLEIKKSFGAGITENLVLIGGGVAVLFWFLESAIHAFVFNNGGFLENLLSTDLNEIWMRLLVITIIAMFSFYTQGVISRRRLAEEALRNSEERFRQFFENEPEYCYMISPDGTILNVNNSALETLGYNKDELVGKPLKTIYAPECLPKMKEVFEKWKKTGRLENEELTIITRKDERRMVLLSAEAVKSSDGRLLHSVSVQRDITEHKRAEEALNERIEDLERFRKTAVGREFRLKELKDEILHLRAKLKELEENRKLG